MKGVLIILISIALLLTIISYMSVAANKGVERQKYQVVKKEEGFEIRFYPKAIFATYTGTETNRNFRHLANYIFGGNKASTQIPMTAPVYMEKDRDMNHMSFVLPSNLTMTELPTPNDTNIKIHYSDVGYYAAISFGGFRNEEKIKRKEEELKVLLMKAGLETLGNYKYLGYNAPWEILNRENDIIVKINYSRVN